MGDFPFGSFFLRTIYILLNVQAITVCNVQTNVINGKFAKESNFTTGDLSFFLYLVTNIEDKHVSLWLAFELYETIIMIKNGEDAAVRCVKP